MNLSPFFKVIFIISLVLFITSFTQDSFTINDYDGVKSFSGIESLVMGALAILGGGFLEWIIWLANPLYLLSIFLWIKKYRKANIVSLIASILALSFFFWKSILAAENGRIATITSKEVGYYIWLAAILLWSCILFFDRRSLNESY